MSGHPEHDEASADRAEDRARAKRLWSELTRPQREFVEECIRWTDYEETVGCGAKGGKQLEMARRLEEKGLIRDIGSCPVFDDPRRNERDLYRFTFAVTELGRLAAS